MAKAEVEEKATAVQQRGSDSLQDVVRRIRENNDGGGLRRIAGIDLQEMTPNKVSSKPPEHMWVDPAELWVDGTYQRDLSRESLRLIIKIITQWSWHQFKPPVVTADKEGRLCIIDGQHTAIGAASHPDIKRIPVMFIPIDSLEESAKAFIGHNTNRVLVTPFAKFRARLAANDEVAHAIQRITQELGITIVPYSASSGKGETVQPNQTAASGELEQRYTRLGEAKFLELMTHVAECGFKPIRREHIVAFAELLFGDNKDSVSPELLVEVVTSLNDMDSLINAKRISQAGRGITQGRALAIHYLGRYQKVYSDTPRRGNRR